MNAKTIINRLREEQKKQLKKDKEVCQNQSEDESEVICPTGKELEDELRGQKKEIEGGHQLVPARETSDLQRRQVTLFNPSTREDIRVSVLEDPQARWACGNGATLWDSAIVLANYLLHDVCHSCDREKGRLSFLELGAGTGLPGIVMFMAGHFVVTTERPIALDLLQANVYFNSRDSNLGSTGNIQCASLEWSMKDDDYINQLLPLDICNCDLVIGSDLIFPKNESCWKELANVWKSLLRKPTTIGYMSYEERGNGDVISRFKSLLSAVSLTCIRVFSEEINMPADIHVYKINKHRDFDSEIIF